MKSIRAALLAIALAPLLSEGAFLDDLAAKSNRTQESPFATGGDIILKISSREYVHIFTNVNTVSTFQLTERSIARILCVGGGGPGGRYHSQHPISGGGGGAGGFVEKEDVKLAAGTYSIVVGKGGAPSAFDKTNNSGGDSAVITSGEIDIVRAHGGGGGGSPSSYSTLNTYEDARCGRDGASGGGSCAWDYGDKTGKGGNALYEGVEGHRGGLAKGSKESGKNEYGAGGGGASQEGYHNYDTTNPGKGGAGKSCDITGEELWYAGGGAGGIVTTQVTVSIAGGKGGGGSILVNPWITTKVNGTPAVRGTGGGGYGGSRYGSTNQTSVGNGADGIVIVRVVRASEGFKVIVR
jgi:hypothetical protein